jgi:acylphosphatase
MADKSEIFVRAHVIFRGRVQGVFFRSNTRSKAVQLGLKGWVRNVEDGSVEAVIEGPKDKVNRLIEWCKTGQPYAHVTKVELKWQPYRDEFEAFEIKYGYSFD